MERIRVSCACLGRIEILGKYLLIQNKSTRNNSVIVYSPIGGALEYKPEVYDFLVSLGAEFEKGMDLRLSLPKDNLEKFTEWFVQKKNRETDIFREMKEEIVDEEKFLDKLDKTDFVATYQHTAIIEQDREIKGVIKPTISYFEIFTVKFVPIVEKEILERLKKSDKLFLFTDEEIKNNINGVITGSSKYILP